jgi:hypothetical protein
MIHGRKGKEREPVPESFQIEARKKVLGKKGYKERRQIRDFLSLFLCVSLSSLSLSLCVCVCMCVCMCVYVCVVFLPNITVNTENSTSLSIPTHLIMRVTRVVARRGGKVWIVATDTIDDKAFVGFFPVVATTTVVFAGGGIAGALFAICGDQRDDGDEEEEDELGNGLHGGKDFQLVE